MSKSDLCCLVEEVQQDAGEVVCVVVWIAQLICQGIQEEIAALSVQVVGQAHEDVQGGLMHGIALWSRLVQVDGLQANTTLVTWILSNNRGMQKQSRSLMSEEHHS